MAVTILERPEGNILSSTGVDGVTYDFGGFFQIDTTPSGHGLVTGDIFYAQSNIENYNGFFKVGAYNAVQIQPLNLDGTMSGLEFLQAVNITVYHSTLTHGWSAVHLPITYKLSTNLYPVNSSDTSRSINSVQDANGYTVLQLSGSLGTIHTYDFVKITVPNDTDLSGVYQILEYISDTVLIINLLYDSSNNFTSATALKHYNNYNILVRVYAGLNASHEWTSQKPYELAATLQFVPDEDNEVFFSINELLKSYIETRNNLVLGTLPNNIDFFTQFYIEVAESYDDSDGYTFGTNTTSFTSDQSNFEGVAVNAKLEFKNIYSGYMSKYVGVEKKFLTLFNEPVLFVGTYFDLSFIVDYYPTIVKRVRYLDGVLQGTSYDVLTLQDLGVYRHQIEQESNEDQIDVTLVVRNASATNATSNFTPGAVVNNFDLYIPAGEAGAGTYDYDIAIISGVTAGDSTTILIEYVHPDGTTTQVFTSTRTTVGSTTVAGTALPTPTKDVIQIRVTATIVDAPAGGLNAASTAQINVVSSEYEISETKTIIVNEDCSNQSVTITFLNNLAGFDYWTFLAQSDHIREIQEAIITKKNILPQWPKSYGADADTIRKQSKRVSNKAYTIRSQFVTEDQIDALSYIKSSILVQIINSRTDRRTVTVDTDSFIPRKDGDKTHEIAFNISFTDDISVQTL